ncbi:hypothetical protein [Bartonella vinsonii]|uniref:Putative membrane protein n=1 Tax=Bartonella vinsonii subsp. berkhoffii str. Tweed TaxID=1094502 RepID=N6VSH9_BARVB|nr:hypothetical protein [Bartonella vinsonii]ENN93997.1 putative membrane protein [Bartonella vinsonii subsp. berkhoffii str. Tweed]
MLFFKKAALCRIKKIFTLILFLPFPAIVCFMILVFNPLGLNNEQQDKLAVPIFVAFVSYFLILNACKQQGKLNLKAENIDSTFNELLSLQFQTAAWAAMAAVFVFYPVIGIAFLGVLIFIAIIQNLDEILPIVAIIALILICLIAFIALIKFIWKIV